MSDKIPNTNRFSVPKRYFDAFKERMDAEIKLDQLLSDTKETGFIVPDNYFIENLEHTKTAVIKPVKVIPLFNRRWLWTAASIAAIVLLIIAIVPKNDTSVTVAAMEDYLLDESVFDLADLLEDEELNELSSDLFDDDVYIDYLNDSTDAYDFFLE